MTTQEKLPLMVAFELHRFIEEQLWHNCDTSCWQLKRHVFVLAVENHGSGRQLDSELLPGTLAQAGISKKVIESIMAEWDEQQEALKLVRLPE